MKRNGSSRQVVNVGGGSREFEGASSHVQFGARVWVFTTLVVADKLADARVARLANRTLSASGHALVVHCRSFIVALPIVSLALFCWCSAIDRLLDDEPPSVPVCKLAFVDGCCCSESKHDRRHHGELIVPVGGGQWVSEWVSETKKRPGPAWTEGQKGDRSDPSLVKVHIKREWYITYKCRDSATSCA